MIQAFSHIFYFFNKASPCGDMLSRRKKKPFFTIGSSNLFRGLTHLGSGSTKKMFFDILLFDSCKA
jgi:hypothetical protein